MSGATLILQGSGEWAPIKFQPNTKHFSFVEDPSDQTDHLASYTTSFQWRLLSFSVQ